MRDVSGFDKNTVKGMVPRDCYKDLIRFIDSRDCCYGKIACLYGLRRTGKTVLLEQAYMAYDEDTHQGRCRFYEIENHDTMDDIYNKMEEDIKKGADIIFLDEVTNATDFIQDSALLADLYAKRGIRIVVAGTDSLGIAFAADHALYDRTRQIHTTYIPFAEHSRVLGTTDMDEYIRYGGLMSVGKQKQEITDIMSARKYLDEAVAENMARSLDKYPEGSRFRRINRYSVSELKTMIRKIVEIYSGAVNEKILNQVLKNVTITYPMRKLIPAVSAFESKILRLKRKDISNEYAEILNIDCNPNIPVTADFVEELETVLKELGVLSMIRTETCIKEHNTWSVTSIDYDIHVIQSAIKYHHLEEGKRLLDKSAILSGISRTTRDHLMSELETKILGDMLEVIVLYDVSNALSQNQYEVLKPVFRINNAPAVSSVPQTVAEYDMLICDKENHKSYKFEIKHTKNPFFGFTEDGIYNGQDRHLINTEFAEICNEIYYPCESAIVLYNGISGYAPTGTLFFNVSDFLCHISEMRDVEQVVSRMKRNLPELELKPAYLENYEKAKNSPFVRDIKNDMEEMLEENAEEREL